MSTTLFDTSSLVAAFCAWHTEHQGCRVIWTESLRQGQEIAVSAHTLVELYSVLTRLPAPHRLSPQISHKLVKGNLADKRVVSLSGHDYLELLEECKEQRISGGTVYDAVIVKAAVRSGADRLVTLNERHFQRLVPDTITVLRPQT